MSKRVAKTAAKTVAKTINLPIYEDVWRGILFAVTAELKFFDCGWDEILVERDRLIESGKLTFSLWKPIGYKDHWEEWGPPGPISQIELPNLDNTLIYSSTVIKTILKHTVPGLTRVFWPRDHVIYLSVGRREMSGPNTVHISTTLILIKEYSDEGA